MVQSESTNSKSLEDGDNMTENMPLPRRTFTVEFLVGIFMIVSVAAGAYLSIGLGGMQLFGADRYSIYAEFDNVSGLKYGAPVEIAGVPVGEVGDISLRKSVAVVRMDIRKGVHIRDDDIAQIRTQGIIGDRYVKISRGASEITVGPGETMMETESVVDIEDIIGKIVHSLGSDDED